MNRSVFLKRSVRVGAGSEPQVTEIHYSLQARFRLARELEFGVPAFGELGQWNHWNFRDKQNHRIGPAIFGQQSLGGREAIRYDFSLLAGASKAAPHSMLRLQLEHEFQTNYVMGWAISRTRYISGFRE